MSQPRGYPQAISLAPKVLDTYVDIKPLMELKLQGHQTWCIHEGQKVAVSQLCRGQPVD